MARHRNIRKLDYSEEYAYDEVYGRSLEDEVAVSPSTAAEFMYHRDSRDNPSLNTFLHGSLGAEEKTPAVKSPLATSSCSAVTPADINPPPGFAPKTRKDNDPPPPDFKLQCGHAAKGKGRVVTPKQLLIANERKKLKTDLNKRQFYSGSHASFGAGSHQDAVSVSMNVKECMSSGPAWMLESKPRQGNSNTLCSTQDNTLPVASKHLSVSEESNATPVSLPTVSTAVQEAADDRSSLNELMKESLTEPVLQKTEKPPTLSHLKASRSAEPKSGRTEKLHSLNELVKASRLAEPYSRKTEPPTEPEFSRTMKTPSFSEMESRSNEPDSSETKKSPNLDELMNMSTLTEPKVGRTEKPPSLSELIKASRSTEPKSSKTEKPSSLSELMKTSRSTEPKSSKTEKPSSLSELMKVSRSTEPKSNKTEKPSNLSELMKVSRSTEHKSNKTEKPSSLSELMKTSRSTDPKSCKTEKPSSLSKLMKTSRSTEPKSSETEKPSSLNELIKVSRSTEPEVGRTEKPPSLSELMKISRSTEPKSSKTEKPPSLSELVKVSRSTEPEAGKTEKHPCMSESMKASRSTEPESSKTEKPPSLSELMKVSRSTELEGGRTEKPPSLSELMKESRSTDPVSNRTDKSPSLSKLMKVSKSIEPESSITEKPSSELMKESRLTEFMSSTTEKPSSSELVKELRSTEHVLSKVEKPPKLSELMKESGAMLKKSSYSSAPVCPKQGFAGNIPQKVKPEDTSASLKQAAAHTLSELLKESKCEGTTVSLSVTRERTTSENKHLSLSELMKEAQLGKSSALSTGRGPRLQSALISRPPSGSGLVPRSGSGLGSRPAPGPNSVSLSEIIESESDKRSFQFSDSKELGVGLAVEDIGNTQKTTSCMAPFGSQQLSLTELASLHFSQQGQVSSGRLSSMLPPLTTPRNESTRNQEQCVTVQLQFGQSLSSKCMKSTIVSSSMCGVHQKLQAKLSRRYHTYFIQAFDFTTASPDDVVKEKQEKVFKR